jgi:hypothetical protein
MSHEPIGEKNYIHWNIGIHTESSDEIAALVVMGSKFRVSVAFDVREAVRKPMCCHVSSPPLCQFIVQEGHTA